MTSEELRKALLDFIGNTNATMIATVKSVDKDKCICTAEENGVEYFDIRLRPTTGSNTGIVMYPKIGATMLSVKIESTEEWAMIYATEYDSIEILIDSLVMNDGSFGGLVKIQELTNKLNALVNVYNSHTHPVATTGTAAAQSGTAATTTAQAQTFNKSDYENTKIKH